MTRPLTTAFTSAAAALCLNISLQQDRLTQTTGQSPGQTPTQTPGQPSRPTAPDQPQPSTTRPQPGQAGDTVELRGELVSLAEFFSSSGAPRSPGTGTPGSSTGMREGPLGVLVRNDARSGNRDQLYVLVPTMGERDISREPSRFGQENTFKGRIAERAGAKVLIVTADSRTPGDQSKPGTTPSGQPGQPGQPGTSPRDR